jgi:hypothetical protein
MRPWLAVSIILLLLASGCMGGKSKQTADPTSTDPDSLPAGVSNILEGSVTAADQTPLAGVNMTINGLGWSNITNEAGYYRFESLPPKDYIITANKEGYRPKPQRAVIQDDAIFQLDFSLEEVPNEAPRHTTTPQTFLIACEIAHQTAPDNPQRQSCVSTLQLPDNKQTHDFDIERGAAQVQAEFFWDKQSEAAKMLYVTAEAPGESGVQFAYDKGETGMKVVISQSLMKKSYPDGGKVRITVNAAPGFLGDESAADWGLMLQQKIDCQFTVFYIEPGPPSFTAKPQ